jgi:glutamyl-tRNA synthetase
LGDEEKFSFEQLSQAFNMDKVSLGGSVFDIEKLNWLSGRYIREDRTPAALMEDMKAWLLNDEYLAQMIPLMQERMETLGDFMPKVAFFLARQVTPDVEDLVPKKQQAEEVAPMLQTVIWALDEALVLDRDAAEAAVRRVAQFWDWPIRDVTVPLIVAITGQRVGPPLFESVVLMGPDLVRARLLEAMGVLGGVSKKKASKLEKQWGQADG